MMESEWVTNCWGDLRSVIELTVTVGVIGMLGHIVYFTARRMRDRWL